MSCLKHLKDDSRVRRLLTLVGLLHWRKAWVPQHETRSTHPDAFLDACIPVLTQRGSTCGGGRGLGPGMKSPKEVSGGQMLGSLRSCLDLEQHMEGIPQGRARGRLE